MMNTVAVVFLGLVASQGFGERPGPAIGITLRSGPLRASTAFEMTHKRESGRGYLASADLDVGRTLFVGMGLHYRDGGLWTKTSAWARAGVQSSNLRFVLRHDFTSENRVSIAEGLVEGGWQTVRVRLSLGVGTYRSGLGVREWGTFSGVQIGVRP